MSDFGQCSDSSCTDTSVRLFECAHHCKQMVCLQHLIAHDQAMEQNRRALESIRNDLTRSYAVYSSLVNESKIRFEYERKLEEYKRFVCDVNYIFENKSEDVEHIRIVIDKLKKAISDKQKPSNESLSRTSPLRFARISSRRFCLAIVKVEPVEEIPRPPTANSGHTDNTSSRSYRRRNEYWVFCSRRSTLVHQLRSIGKVSLYTRRHALYRCCPSH